MYYYSFLRHPLRLILFADHLSSCVIARIKSLALARTINLEPHVFCVICDFCVTLRSKEPFSYLHPVHTQQYPRGKPQRVPREYPCYRHGILSLPPHSPFQYERHNLLCLLIKVKVKVSVKASAPLPPHAAQKAPPCIRILQNQEPGFPGYATPLS